SPRRAGGRRGRPPSPPTRASLRPSSLRWLALLGLMELLERLALRVAAGGREDRARGGGRSGHRGDAGNPVLHGGRADLVAVGARAGAGRGVDDEVDLLGP